MLITGEYNFQWTGTKSTIGFLLLKSMDIMATNRKVWDITLLFMILMLNIFYIVVDVVFTSHTPCFLGARMVPNC